MVTTNLQNKRKVYKDYAFGSVLYNVAKMGEN